MGLQESRFGIPFFAARIAHVGDGSIFQAVARGGGSAGFESVAL